ncbi:hypothetical protein [Helicobacter labetoulli]|nr:hypothetical protein [Helicobacter labetoulli]
MTAIIAMRGVFYHKILIILLGEEKYVEVKKLTKEDEEVCYESRR